MTHSTVNAQVNDLTAGIDPFLAVAALPVTQALALHALALELEALLAANPILELVLSADEGRMDLMAEKCLVGTPTEARDPSFA
ncbi:hypothetical protein Taro_040316 [Colocasia esculenta]|uniref:Uncharacterized protein n=1 Tax=Colocasia esculenta TaxID=4460 RepID=A0A843WIC4_COLES|nr:hypothetical protein [Colocasia esculenta]